MLGLKTDNLNTQLASRRGLTVGIIEMGLTVGIIEMAMGGFLWCEQHCY